jgi:hypothetical protein
VVELPRQGRGRGLVQPPHPFVDLPLGHECEALEGQGHGHDVREPQRAPQLARLAHDFVVRDFATHRGIGRAESRFKPAPGWNLAQMSVAAFVQNARTGEILQAVSTPACNPIRGQTP